MTTWKQKAAQSIVNHAAPADTAPIPTRDSTLKGIVQQLLDTGKVPASALDFVRDVMRAHTRFGSFTERQAIALHNIVSRIENSNVDAALAAKLKAALPSMPASDARFASSLLDGFARYGSFTDGQRPHVERLASSMQVAAPVVLTQTVEVAQAKTYPALCGLVNLDKFARFTVGDLKLTLKNDGSVIWVKYDNTLFGVIDSATARFRMLKRGLDERTTDRAIELLDHVESDPASAAKADGILTGRCSCCGRPLTDPTSIAIGVGPICLGKAGW